MSEYDYLFKIMLIGDSSVGKTSLVMRYADKQYNDDFQPTIGVDFRINTVVVDDKVIKLQIWDTAGQERFQTITSFYYKGSHAIILNYDITDRYSFENIHKWLNDLNRYSSDICLKLLVGNKKDLESERKVQFSEGQELANQLDMQFIETSAKEDLNIDKLFLTITKSLKKQAEMSKQMKTAEPGVNLNQTQIADEGTKCG